MKWKKLSDGGEVDLVTYVKNWVEKNPGCKLYVGCDSQNYTNKAQTIFGTVIVLHHKGSGGHVIYNRTCVPIMVSEFERLWKEVEFSMEAVVDLEASGVGKPDYVDLDLNPDPRYRSNSLLRAAVGLIESMGIKTRHKTLSNWSIPIADKICR
jgi:predicted RNase H-related nuclease YkuK (DUF458 family)